MRPIGLCFCFAVVAISMANVKAEQAKPDNALCGPYPKLYKEIVWNWLQKSLVDAGSAKIEWEGEPSCTDLGKGDQHVYGWLINFTVNSRNRFGSYTGKQKHGALIRNGEVIKGIGFGY